MTKEQINSLLERVRNWPAGRQEDAAQILLAMEAQGSEPYRLTEEERTDLEEALAEIARGEVASDEEVGALFNRFGR